MAKQTDPELIEDLNAQEAYRPGDWITGSRALVVMLQELPESDRHRAAIAALPNLYRPGDTVQIADGMRVQVVSWAEGPRLTFRRRGDTLPITARIDPLKFVRANPLK